MLPSRPATRFDERPAPRHGEPRRTDLRLALVLALASGLLVQGTAAWIAQGLL